ncbi:MULTISPECIES: ABC transporter ATP-binding protein [Halorussus]|uniref:ABC transporter ATP-binding protein n=1 Tax=Halorussus TaxID=1070314 RepID=UPI00209CF649|nr:ABC transporter ATP-binding protein [Halorussus vallis]USZ75540.1 ABC transporter ATP-binding protein [Halorussus vallis]
MAPTVDSKERSRRKRIHYGLFIVGVFTLVAGVVMFIPAIQYEFQQDASAYAEGEHVNRYESLTPQERRIVDGALDGKTYVLETSEPLPGTAKIPLQPQHVKVKIQGTTHTFTYRLIFPATVPKGMATIGLAVGGLLMMGEAVRRHHFPKSLPWQTS